MRRKAVVAPVLGVLVLVTGCGGGGSDDDARVTTSSILDEARVAGREVCDALFSDPTMVPSLERARAAGPQLGTIVEDLAAVRAEVDQGRLNREQFVGRLTVLLPAFEIVCEDDYGVTAPPDYYSRDP